MLSGVEVHGADEYDTAANTTSQLDYYVDMPSEEYGETAYKYPRAVKQYNGSDNWWLLRPAYSNNYSDFRNVTDYGYLIDFSAYYFSGVSPAFRIG